MKTRIYVDTSVIGGCEDDEFRDHSLQLMASFARGKCTLVLSDLTILELRRAPEAVRNHLDRIPDAQIETLRLDASARELANEYVSAGVIGGSMLADARHIAIATLGRVDVLVSWNFKHIVNLQRIHGYNSVNLRLGLPMLEIRTPREVLPNEQ